MSNDQLLPDILDGMSMSTGAGITDAEMLGAELYTRFWERNKNDDARPFEKQSEAIKHMWVCIATDALAAMRAVEARTRQAPPAPDAVALKKRILQPIAAWLAEDYNNGDALRIANLCDERLDRTGNLLGWVREEARAARHTGEK